MKNSELLTRAREKVQAIADGSLIDLEDRLRSGGGTQQEVAKCVAQQRAVLQESIAAEMDRLAQWLRNGGETSH